MTKEKFQDRYPHLYECHAAEIFDEVIDPLQTEIANLKELLADAEAEKWHEALLDYRPEIGTAWREDGEIGVVIEQAKREVHASYKACCVCKHRNTVRFCDEVCDDSHRAFAFDA